MEMIIIKKCMHKNLRYKSYNIYIYIYILLPTFSVSALFRRLFRTAIFSRFSQVAIATSNFMNEFYNGGFTPEFSVSMLKETIALVRDHVSETRK